MRTLPKVGSELNKFHIRNWKADLARIAELEAELELARAEVLKLTEATDQLEIEIEGDWDEEE